MRFGAHINANTSFDQTVYQLQIPTDNPAVIDRSLLIMEDWAHAVSFDPDEIDKERGVILEEWRPGLGAGARMLDVQLPVLLKDSRYAERLPIGKPDIIRNFPYDRLKKFYKDWYRPDLMAVIAVGDFDPATIEALIKSHFGSIPAAVSPKPRQSFDVPDQPGTRYTIATDAEATATTVSVSSDDGGPRSDDARRLPAADNRARVRRPALGAARGDRAQAGRAVSRRRHQPEHLRPDGRGDDAHRARPRRRRRARAGGALHRGRSRGAVRVHRRPSWTATVSRC